MSALPDRRAILAAITLQSSARESVLASLSAPASFSVRPTAKIENYASASEGIASRSSCGRW